MSIFFAKLVKFILKKTYFTLKERIPELSILRVLGYSLLLLGNAEVIQNLLETGIKDWFLVGMNSLVIRWYCFKKALRCP